MKTKYTHIIWYVIIVLINAAGIKAEEIKTNVLSYYAITNQLDGQPMIDMNNVLRFYPVFYFRDKTLEVHITIYKNGSRYHVPAIANEDKSFWEIKLPPFELGEAIQRIEVEVKINTTSSYGDALTEYKNTILQEMKNNECKSGNNADDCGNLRCCILRRMLCDVESASKNDYNTEYILSELGDTNNISKSEPNYNDHILARKKLFEPSALKYNILYLKYREELQIKNKYLIELIKANLSENLKKLLEDSLIENSLKQLASELADVRCEVEEGQNENLVLLQTRKESLTRDSVVLRKIKDRKEADIVEIKKDLDRKIFLSQEIDDLNRALSNLKQILEKTTRSNSCDPCLSLEIDLLSDLDTNSTIDIKKFLLNQLHLAKRSLKSSKKQNSDFDVVYKKYLTKVLSDTMNAGVSIRTGDIVTIENSEAKLLYRNYKRGIRYLTALDPAERLGIFRLRYIPFAIIGKDLVKPVGDNPTGIFEVGMSFGDPIVSGDDFTVPPFAPERLGVAFAISNEFFSDSARVAALALTYDFNSYGSIAVGSNFNTKEKKIQSYLSFGINKKAFEGLVKAIKNLFN